MSHFSEYMDKAVPLLMLDTGVANAKPITTTTVTR